jgi:hypothetical protein
MTFQKSPDSLTHPGLGKPPQGFFFTRIIRNIQEQRVENMQSFCKQHGGTHITTVTIICRKQEDDYRTKTHNSIWESLT